MSDFFAGRVLRLPAFAYQGETATDPVFGFQISSIAAQSWEGRLVGGLERAGWPILWSVPAMARASGFSEEEYLSSLCLLAPAVKWGSGGGLPRAPRTVILSLSIDASVEAAVVASLSTALRGLGVMVSLPAMPAASAGLNAFGCPYLAETLIETSDLDPGGGFAQPSEVSVASDTKFIGGDLLVVNVVQEVQIVGQIDNSGLFWQYNNYAAASAAQLVAAADRFRKVQVVNIYSPAIYAADWPGNHDGIAAMYGAHAPPFVSLQLLGNWTATPAAPTDADLEASAVAAIKDFFQIA